MVLSRDTHSNKPTKKGAINIAYYKGLVGGRTLTEIASPYAPRADVTKVSKKIGDTGEPAPEDGDIEELSYHEMLLNRESNPGLPRLVGVNDKRKS